MVCVNRVLIYSGSGLRDGLIEVMSSFQSMWS